MKSILKRLIEYETLDQKTAYDTLLKLSKGEYNISHMVAFVSIYMMRSITVEELLGFREAMLALCIPVYMEDVPIDIVGTGGDAKNTFNISTTAAFVVAGAGQKVIKHTNYGFSSLCGASNVMEYLGYTFKKSSQEIQKEADKSGLSFIHAPYFHPAMKNIAPIRKELALRTFFNMLGPITNPVQNNSQFSGVYNLELARIYYYTYQRLNKKYAFVHALDGYDEISLTGDTKVFTSFSEKIYSPSDFGFKKINPSDIFWGGSIENASKILLKILQNKGSEAQTQVVLVNAAMALKVAKDCSFDVAMEMSKDSLFSGKAFNCFKKLVS